jgi:ribosome-associated translation inhibitor RaiA
VQIQVNTESSVQGSEALAKRVETVVRGGLERFGAQITRIEVHLSDVNSDKKSGAEDMRCLLEARLAGRPPVSVSDRAATLEQAVDGAVDKLLRSLESLHGRLGGR